MSDAHKVLWFPPDRPVEGNTIYVRPEVDDTDSLSAHGMDCCWECFHGRPTHLADATCCSLEYGAQVPEEWFA